MKTKTGKIISLKFISSPLFQTERKETGANTASQWRNTTEQQTEEINEDDEAEEMPEAIGRPIYDTTRQTGREIHTDPNKSGRRRGTNRYRWRNIE